MKWIGNRISYQQHDGFFTMIITSKTEDWKMIAMIVWLIIWLGCGSIIFYFLLFTNELKTQHIYFYTFLGFWFYFLYKIFRVIIWRKFGQEFIRIDDDRISIKKSIFGYGSAKTFLTKNINNFKIQLLKNNSFSKVFNDSFWIVGQGTIIVDVLGKEYNFGAQVSKENGQKAAKILNLKINKIKSAS